LTVKKLHGQFAKNNRGHMIRKLYDWSLGLAAHPRAIWALAFICFIEASFFPIPPDVMLIPMIIAAPHRAWAYATVALVASVLGGIFGYGIGMFAYEFAGEPILEALGKADAMAEFSQRFNEYGLWTVITAGITPLPFKVITIMSGATAMPFGMFVVAAITARAIRFFAVALLLYYFGAPIRTFIERWLGWLFLAFIIVLFAGFWGIRYL
jgi:membrane protein YqaA with SNARE-associated domain